LLSPCDPVTERFEEFSPLFFTNGTDQCGFTNKVLYVSIHSIAKTNIIGLHNIDDIMYDKGGLSAIQ
jgi:hypothetical protein